jgi:hypothetical protein
MAIYSFENKAFQKIGETNFNNEGILERQHLQAALKTQIDIEKKGQIYFLKVPNVLIHRTTFSRR